MIHPRRHPTGTIPVACMGVRECVGLVHLGEAQARAVDAPEKSESHRDACASRGEEVAVAGEGGLGVARERDELADETRVGAGGAVEGAARVASLSPAETPPLPSNARLEKDDGPGVAEAPRATATKATRPRAAAATEAVTRLRGRSRMMAGRTNEGACARAVRGDARSVKGGKLSRNASRGPPPSRRSRASADSHLLPPGRRSEGTPLHTSSRGALTMLSLASNPWTFAPPNDVARASRSSRASRARLSAFGEPRAAHPSRSRRAKDRNVPAKAKMDAHGPSSPCGASTSNACEAVGVNPPSRRRRPPAGTRTRAKPRTTKTPTTPPTSTSTPPTPRSPSAGRARTTPSANDTPSARVLELLARQEAEHGPAQGSDEWLLARARRVSASEASAALGVDRSPQPRETHPR